MDITAIAEYIGADPHTFMAEYCQRSGGKPILTQSPNGYCIFWDKLCTIHPVKPRMCREWPFIESVLVDAKNWHAMAGSCPGMRTDVVDDTITACVRGERDKLDPV
jgi:Fe-S-cluster containining protein